MKKCKECCKEISEDEYSRYNGYCQECFKEKEKEEAEEDDDDVENFKSFSLTAGIIKCIAVLGSIIGIFVGINLEGYTFAVIILSIISGIFIYAFGKIIQLLNDIKNRL